jgi:hypothetical protein|tara:strand:- start:68 stop:868 length:801 start_codon:yes stop_codon:yes gene_type:complete
MKHLVIGNGESRKWFGEKQYEVNAVTWGCNAIYRDVMVDNLVAVDYGMQQEIYDSGYSGVCHFANWSVLPSSVADMMFMGYDIPEAFVHRSKNRTDNCVISGKDPVTLKERIESAIQMFPSLDMKDLQMKMEKDVGVWITYVSEDDNINTIDFPIGWSAGNTAMHLACQQGATEIYILGFDLSSYDEPLNNMYKGTDNYLSGDARGFNPVNWQNQMQTVFREFKDVQFSWVVSRPWDWPDAKEELIQENNLSYLTKTQFCDKVSIL